MSNWLLIASAPKDGERIITSSGGMVGVSRWSKSFAPVYGFDGAGWYSEALDRPHFPTHWQPLPSPANSGDAA